MNDEFESWLNTSPIPVIYRQYSDNKDDVLDFLTLLKYPNLYIPNTHVVISLEFLHKILGNKMSKINWCDNLTVNESELYPVTNNMQNQCDSLPFTATDSVNTRNKHKWYDVILAWAEGKEIQFRPIGNSKDWFDVISFGSDSPNFNIDTYEWRIKPRKIEIAYRIKLGYETYNEEYPRPILISCTVDKISNTEEYLAKNDSYFIKWLTDWTIIEVEENI